jgi:hypothetical protein
MTTEWVRCFGFGGCKWGGKLGLTTGFHFFWGCGCTHKWQYGSAHAPRRRRPLHPLHHERRRGWGHRAASSARHPVRRGAHWHGRAPAVLSSCSPVRAPSPVATRAPPRARPRSYVLGPRSGESRRPFQHTSSGRPLLPSPTARPRGAVLAGPSSGRPLQVGPMPRWRRRTTEGGRIFASRVGANLKCVACLPSLLEVVLVGKSTVNDPFFGLGHVVGVSLRHPL